MEIASRDYFERRAQDEARRAEAAPSSEIADAHRQLELLYRAKLEANEDRLGMVDERSTFS